MSSRINNSHSCIACARRSQGLAVGTPTKLGWFCDECDPTIARRALYMKNMDAVEQRACEKVAAQVGDDPLTIPPNELPAFISWAVKSFAETIRKDLDEGGAPF